MYVVGATLQASASFSRAHALFSRAHALFTRAHALFTRAHAVFTRAHVSFSRVHTIIVMRYVRSAQLKSLLFILKSQKKQLVAVTAPAHCNKDTCMKPSVAHDMLVPCILRWRGNNGTELRTESPGKDSSSALATHFMVVRSLFVFWLIHAC